MFLYRNIPENVIYIHLESYLHRKYPFHGLVQINRIKSYFEYNFSNKKSFDVNTLLCYISLTNLVLKQNFCDVSKYNYK